ncbi:DUF2637 domain-containing protein [Actinomadura sp. NTSP31]|uniref:DUF2637 domain-containing protein n=1 Tax=Actinomadura sp. NTSP31 TaxID=1735447 RepID=UPI0035BEFDE4
MTRPTFLAHRASIVLIAVAVIAVTTDGFAQSYAGLYRWALEHHLTEWKAQSFPLLVDLFVLVGELALFSLALEGHRLKKNGLAWVDAALPFGIATAGWGVSLVFNVGAAGHEFSDRATAAVPPVASMLGLLVLLRTLHRLVARGTEHTAGAVAALEDAEPVDDIPDGAVATIQRDEIGSSSSGGSDAAALMWWPLPGLETVPVPVPEPDGRTAEDDDQAPADDPEDESRRDPADDPEDDPAEGVPEVPADVLARAREEFAEHLQHGDVPGVRRIRRVLKCGQPRAQQVRAYLAVLAEK